MRDIPATGHQQFQRIVQTTRITAFGIDNGQKFRDGSVQPMRSQQFFPRLHVPDVAPKRVNFSVVRQVTERLSQFP